MTAKRNPKPSRAVAVGAPVGAIVGGMLEAAAAAHGIPMPPGTGAVLAGTLAGLFAYFTKGGRKGETH